MLQLTNLNKCSEFTVVGFFRIWTLKNLFEASMVLQLAVLQWLQILVPNIHQSFVVLWTGR